MIDLIKVFNKILKELKKDESNIFNNAFILTCMLIWKMSNDGEQLDGILAMLKEFDYAKNFRGVSKDE